MKATDIIQKLTSELENTPQVKSFVVVGSQVRNRIYVASEYSDIEAYIIVDDNDVVQIQTQLPDIVNRLGKVLFSYHNQWAGFSTVFDDLTRLELPLAKLSQLESVFSRPKAQEVRVIFDRTDGILQSALEKRTDKIDFEMFFQDLVKDFWYMAIVGVQYYKKGEIWNSRSVLQILQSSLIKLFELYNDPNILLLETNKRIEQFLTKEQIAMLKEVSPGYEEQQVVLALKRIIDLYPQISQQTKDKYKYSYDQQIEEEISRKLWQLLG